MNKNKKMIIFITFLVVLGVVITISTTYLYAVMNDEDIENKSTHKIDNENNDKQGNVENYINKNHIKDNKKKNTSDDENDEEKKSLNMEDVYHNPYEDEKSGELLEEMSKADYERLESKLREGARNFDFLETIRRVKEEMNKYKEGENFNDLNSLYSDINRLASIPIQEDEDVDYMDLESVSMEGLNRILNSIKDPELALIGTLAVDFDLRDRYLLSDDSLNPIIDKYKVNFIKGENLSDNYISKLQVSFPTIEHSKKIDFSLDGYPLSAYILINEDGSSQVYKISSNGDDVPFKTVKEWEEYDKRIEKQNEEKEKIRKEWR